MLETEEVDDDYFTPVAKTSLANIFKKPLPDDKPENETLKYSPPIPKVTHTQDKPNANRKFENIFSCVFDAYLWVDDIYTSKGKLGCAVVKVTTQNIHSLILYDSNRSTVSSALATKELEVGVKGKDFISYYDSFDKYWSLYGSEEDIKKIIETLETCDVKIKVLEESSNTVTEQNNPETAGVKINNLMEKNVGSDTDSSMNRRTKASILNRMATMGQSVLPPRNISNDQTSDSSDTNESENHIAASRLKPNKNIVKRNVADKNILEQQRKSDVQKQAITPRHHSIENKTCMVVNDQLMPLQSSTTVFSSTSGNETNFFIAEQRIANSELRINMTRITDKIDNVLNKVSNLEIKEKKEDMGNINTEILLKLLKEYESKIKIYEELLKKVCKDTPGSKQITDLLENEDELILLRNKITELQNCIKQRDNDITILNKDIDVLKNSQLNEHSTTSELSNSELVTKVSELEKVILLMNEMLAKSSVQNDELVSNNHDDEIESKIKTIMNDTFQAVAVNFDNNENYSGESVKSIIATVIKKITIESLKKSK